MNNITRLDLTEDVTLRNIFGFARVTGTQAEDVDGSILGLFDPASPPTHSALRQYTEEVQLQGKSFGRRLDWIIGGFYQDAFTPRWIRTSRVQFFTPTDGEGQNEATSKAVFSQVTYDLSTLLSGLSITGGLRYTWDSAWGKARLGPLGNFCCETESPPQNSEALTWTGGLDYQVTPDTLLYLTSRRGYRPGGENTPVNGIPLPDFDPEYVSDYEFGIKSDWRLADIPLRTNVAVYYQDYSNIQVAQIYQYGPGPADIATITGNAVAAKQWGAELEVELHPTDHLQLGLYGNYLHFRFGEVGDEVRDPQTVGPAAKLNRPRYKYGANLRYHLPTPQEIGNLSMQAQWSWQETSGDRFLVIGGLTPSYGLLNLSLDWNDIAGKPLDLQLYGSNVLDKDYNIGGFGAIQLVGVDVYRFGEPRMYGVRLRYRFGE